MFCTAVPFQTTVPSKSISRSMTSGRWLSGGGGVLRGMSSFTACVMMGRETISVTSNTSMTSINGVVFISHIGWPSALPTLIDISIVS